MSLVANAPLNVEVDAKADAAVGIARAFSFISSDKDTRQAFDWLITVSNTIGAFHRCELLQYSFFYVLVRACLFALLISWLYSFYTSPKSKIFFVLAL